MRFRVLGWVEAIDGDEPVDLGGRQPRLAVALLLAAAGRGVTVDALIDTIWGEDPPASATGSLQSYVSRLRRRLDGVPLVWDEPSYRLDVPAEHVDFRQFEALAERGRSLLETGSHEEAAETLRAAETLWRGPAFGEFQDVDRLRGLAARLEELHLSVLEARLTADLALGRHAAATGELTELATRFPLRERLRELLALALYRSGRQADALRALADAAQTLREELGIEPSRPLRDLEAAILAHDAALDLASGPRTAGTESADGAATVTSSPLVGRDAELAELRAALDESVRDARLVVVEGEPGIGKTRLADELRTIAEARGAIAVWGRSDEGGAAPALWPWLVPLRALAGRVGTADTALAALLAGDAPETAQWAATAQFERFEALAGLLTRAAAETPVVVLLDDLQWADDTSLELLAFLGTRLERGVLVVATLRQLEVGRHDAVTDALATVARRPGSRRLHLRGLAQHDTLAVLAATGGAHVPVERAAAIHDRAEGNPFYAIELARLLDEEGGPAEIPGSIADVIRRRLSHLPTASVDLLGVAAIIGRDVELGLVARAADVSVDECLEGVEPAIVHRLLVDVPERPSVVRFSHALVREVLLDDMSSLRRARLHLRVADAIEARGAGIDDAEILAEHLFQAAPVGGGGRAAVALERAASVALRRVAYGTAEELLKRAVHLRRVTGSSADDDRAELETIVRLLEVARARRYYAGTTELAVIDRAKELAERCDRRDLIVAMMWLEWSAAATSCRMQDRDHLIRALVDVTSRADDPVVRAQGQSAHAVYLWQSGHVADALDVLEASRRLYAEGEATETFDLAAEQRLLNMTFLLHMRAAVGVDSREQSLTAFDALAAEQTDGFALASILGFAGTTTLWLGDWPAVEAIAGRSLDLAPGAQFAFWRGIALMHHGVTLAWRGRLDEAQATFDEGETRFTEVSGRSTLACCQASLALHLADAGRLDDARRIVSRAREELMEYGERWSEPIVLIGEAAVASAAGDAATSVSRLRAATAMATEQGAHAVARRADALLGQMTRPGVNRPQ